MTWPLTLPTGTVYFHEKPMGVFGSAAPSFGKNLPASRGWERKLMRRSAADVAAKPITGDFGVDGGDQSGVASMAFARSSTLCVMRIALDIGRDPESSEPRPHGGDPAALGDVGERGDAACAPTLVARMGSTLSPHRTSHTGQTLSLQGRGANIHHEFVTSNQPSVVFTPLTHIRPVSPPRA